MYRGWVDSFSYVKATFTTCSLIHSGPGIAHISNLRQQIIMTKEMRHTVMKDSPLVSSPDTESDSRQGLALRKGTHNDELFPHILV